MSKSELWIQLWTRPVRIQKSEFALVQFGAEFRAGDEFRALYSNFESRAEFSPDGRNQTSEFALIQFRTKFGVGEQIQSFTFKL